MMTKIWGRHAAMKKGLTMSESLPAAKKFPDNNNNAGENEPNTSGNSNSP